MFFVNPIGNLECYCISQFIFVPKGCHPHHQLQIIDIQLSLCQVIPRWHEHWTSNKVYDGDMIVLQGQEKTFLSQSMGGSADINKQYTNLTFTPTQADRFVLAFRSWLRRHGNSKPEWFGLADKQPLPSAVLSKREVWNPHPPFLFSYPLQELFWFVRTNNFVLWTTKAMHMKWNFTEIDSINVTILVRWQWYNNEFLHGNLPYSPIVLEC